MSVNDLAIRPPKVLREDEPLELGSKRMRLIETSHVSHNWESQMLFEETSATLFCGDILTQMGNRGALVGDDVLEPAIEAEDVFHQNSLSAHCGLQAITCGWQLAATGGVDDEFVTTPGLSQANTVVPGCHQPGGGRGLQGVS